jgi:hypothetical protein
MSDTEKYDHGPLKPYEVVWTNGHVETVQAHQVMMPRPAGLFFENVSTKTHEYIQFHGEIDGRWQLVLAVRPELVDVIRDKSTEEVL